MIYLQSAPDTDGRFAKNFSKSRFERFQSPHVFLNEVDWPRIVKDGLDQLTPGTITVLANPKGQPLACGFFNPISKIVFRVLKKGSFDDVPLTENLEKIVEQRLDAALQKRRRIFPRSSFRLCFGESDGLPGLIIDLFETTEAGDKLRAVIQCHSAGADQLILPAQRWLEKNLIVASGVIRNDLDVRKREGVREYVEVWGADFDETQVFAREGDLRFFVDLKAGQKTGYFYDHRANRQAFAERTQGKLGLDAFSYVGAWGLAMAKKNSAMKVFCVDISGDSLELLLRNAKENNLSSQIEIVEADFLRDEALSATLGLQSFDAVACDPPSMSGHGKDSQSSLKAHERCLYRAMDFLAPQGILAFSACSFHLTWDDLFEMSARVFRSRMEQVCVSYQGGQDSDHPVLTSLPETRYLKCMFLERLR